MVSEPAGSTTSPGRYPSAIVPVGPVEPVPRRIRAMVGALTVLDTTEAVYVWDVPWYPQFYVPVGALGDALSDDWEDTQTPHGTAHLHSLRAGDRTHPGAVLVHDRAETPELRGMAHVAWDAVDRWYEEDVQVFVHPRSPYTRVDALRSSRHVRVELDGVLLAESTSPVLVFETGLPTRYYLDRTDVDFDRLAPSPTRTSCPYKGTTSEYWSVVVDGRTRHDAAWSYDFPTRQLSPVTGLLAFYNEKVDLIVDGQHLGERPRR